jgi:hypothetical protein
MVAARRAGNAQTLFFQTSSSPYRILGPGVLSVGVRMRVIHAGLPTWRWMLPFDWIVILGLRSVKPRRKDLIPAFANSIANQVLRQSSASFATLAAIRRASSLTSRRPDKLVSNRAYDLLYL